MLFARGFILQEKKFLKKRADLLVAIRKKIVRERYVFAGPLPSALPPPPPAKIAFWPVCHCVPWFARPCCIAPLCPRGLHGRMVCGSLWVIPFS